MNGYEWICFIRDFHAVWAGSLVCAVFKKCFIFSPNQLVFGSHLRLWSHLVASLCSLKILSCCFFFFLILSALLVRERDIYLSCWEEEEEEERCWKRNNHSWVHNLAYSHADQAFPLFWPSATAGGTISAFHCVVETKICQWWTPGAQRGCIHRLSTHCWNFDLLVTGHETVTIAWMGRHFDKEAGKCDECLLLH